jgi:hypothetical protein
MTCWYGVFKVYNFHQFSVPKLMKVLSTGCCAMTQHMQLMISKNFKLFAMEIR